MDSDSLIKLSIKLTGKVGGKYVATAVVYGSITNALARRFRFVVLFDWQALNMKRLIDEIMAMFLLYFSCFFMILVSIFILFYFDIENRYLKYLLVFISIVIGLVMPYVSDKIKDKYRRE